MSPTNELSGRRLTSQRIVEARVAAASPRTGMRRNPVHRASAGTTTSLPRSLAVSAKGWYHGGPTRSCTRAVTLRSTHVVMSPTTAEKTNPGKTRY